VEEGNRLLLIDCGLGNKQSEKFFSYYEPHGEDSLEKSLNKAGFGFGDVTDCLLTHLHFDHCGGAVKKEGEKFLPAFPNATYYSHRRHWDWAVNPNAREKASFLKENILPLQEAGQLKFIEQGEEVMPGVNVTVVNGHTEAMLIPVIQYQNHQIAYAADLIPSAGHIPLAYVMAYDIRPLVTLEEKEKFLQRAVAENFTLFFEHDRSVEACTLMQSERGVKKQEELRLSDL
jgi:glyoxylase-like metal-dependent hydrolase (beta-lactamase superfamily II)